MLPVWGYLEGLIFGILLFFLEKLVFSHSYPNKPKTSPKKGFYATHRPSPKGLKVRYTLPSPLLQKKNISSTTNIVSLNKAEVQSVEISWSKRFLHSLC